VIEKKALSLNEAAATWSLSHWTLRRAINQGKLRAMRVGKKILVAPGELERFITGRGRKHAESVKRA
jgi:excisionase family DNA binding protein